MNTLEQVANTDYKELALFLFRDFLRKEKSHLTYERKILFEQICEFATEFCAEDVLEKCSPDGNYISRGTVYKTINLMEESGIIRRIPKQGKKRYYVFLHPGWQKADLICMKCGNRETIDIEADQFLKMTGNNDDFVPTSMTVIINGICSRCR